MPAVVRIGDVDSAGDRVVAGSPNVFANGRPVMRVGDIDDDSFGADSAVTGSPNVFVNGKPLVRVGDKDSDGDIFSSGSSNVFVND